MSEATPARQSIPDSGSCKAVVRRKGPHRPARSELLKAALSYARAGFSVFPLRPGGKKPLTDHGFHDATTNPQRITAWWNSHPTANIGIPTGERSGWLVVDVDPDNGGRESLEVLEAEHGALPATRRHKTGGGGAHYLYHYPTGANIRNSAGKLGPGLDVRAEGGYIVAPPGATKSPYVKLNDLPLADTPEWLLKVLREPRGGSEDHSPGRPGSGTPVSIETGGEPIPEGTRNDTLARIAGRLHDGSRDLDQLTADLLEINEIRCEPSLPEAEVVRIAASIYRRSPCRAKAPEVSPEVLAAADYLESVERPVKGMAGGSGWSIYAAGLELARRYGREHADAQGHGIKISVDVRTWAQKAGTHAGTVSRFIGRSPLVRVLRRGSGRRSGEVLLVTPHEIGYYLQHSNHWGGIEHSTTASVADSTLRRTLQRLRWGPGRIGKSRAALLTTVADCDGPLTRAEIAERLGRKPNSLKAPLRWLVEAGLLVRVGRGLYDTPADLLKRVEDARELGAEPEAERLQIARHQREREGYRNRRAHKVNRAPSDAEMERSRERCGDADGLISALEKLPPRPDSHALTGLINQRVQTSRGPGVLWDFKGSEARVILDESPKIWTPLDISELVLEGVA